MHFCTNCGTQLPDGTVFCISCGQKQSITAVPEQAPASFQPAPEQAQAPFQPAPEQAQAPFQPAPEQTQAPFQPAPEQAQAPFPVQQPMAQPQPMQYPNQYAAPKKPLPVRAIVSVAVFAVCLVIGIILIVSGNKKSYQGVLDGIVDAFACGDQEEGLEYFLPSMKAAYEEDFGDDSFGDEEEIQFELKGYDVVGVIRYGDAFFKSTMETYKSYASKYISEDDGIDYEALYQFDVVIKLQTSNSELSGFFDDDDLSTEYSICMLKTNKGWYILSVE